MCFAGIRVVGAGGLGGVSWEGVLAEGPSPNPLPQAGEGFFWC